METTFEISQGECFPLAALIGERPTRTLHRASGDTFCLSIEHDTFVILFSLLAPFRDLCLTAYIPLLDHVNHLIQPVPIASFRSITSLATPTERSPLPYPLFCSTHLPLRTSVAPRHEHST